MATVIPFYHAFSFRLIGRDWDVYVVHPDGDLTTISDDATAAIVHPVLSSLAGSNPDTFGMVLYSASVMLIAGEIPLRVRHWVFEHEVGHILGWGTGRGDTTEADANLMISIIRELRSDVQLSGILDNSMPWPLPPRKMNQ
jgi:hypothetical protein